MSLVATSRSPVCEYGVYRFHAGTIHWYTQLCRTAIVPVRVHGELSSTILRWPLAMVCYGQGGLCMAICRLWCLYMAIYISHFFLMWWMDYHHYSVLGIRVAIPIHDHNVTHLVIYISHPAPALFFSSAVHYYLNVWGEYSLFYCYYCVLIFIIPALVLTLCR